MERKKYFGSFLRSRLLWRAQACASAAMRRVALSPLWVKLAELQLRFLLTPCLAGACPAALAATLAAGCRALARSFNVLAAEKVSQANCQIILRARLK